MARKETNRYQHVVAPRTAPFIMQGDIRGRQHTPHASDLILQLVRLREQFMRIGMVQTAHAMDAPQLKAGFELADHYRLLQEQERRTQRKT
jgi:hypothetical protein